jgi:hypothetical protein
MGDEGHDRNPRQRNMPLVNTPIQTADMLQTANNRTEAPLITAAAKVLQNPSFILGVDTCGFTTGSTRRFEPPRGGKG